ncbi:NACHT, LRR and PYD domains-containing protein 1b allele 5 isoform X2 [Amia ocellicauda]|uniref:NACHT, LRR and PYD domains-containing protein 1b allele 5 isoform X2 n=1 Tax=Amia ocellicauda TaxID=2972642 RepID=UPI003463A8E7
MVADMTSLESVNHAEGSEGDISPLEQKGNLTENEINGSADNAETGTSTEESSEDEEPDKDDADGGDSEPDFAENCSGRECKVHVDACEDVYIKPSCEKCKAIQNRSFELVTPRKISKGRLLLMLEDEGSYECSITGLVFEVSGKVHIKYSTLSWSKYGVYLKDSWKFAGPIFDVDCDPTILKAIQFPHSLCLADEQGDMTFGLLHIKNNAPVIEPSADHCGTHITWNVTTLSPVGPIVQTSQPVEHHGVVLIYKVLDHHISSSFRVYLATNNHSDIKDIQKEVKHSKKKYIKMEKPPTCVKLLEEKKQYKLVSEPEADITPEGIQFILAAVKFKAYFEVYYEQPPPFKLSLIEADSEKTVWSATLRECDCEEVNLKAIPSKSQPGNKRRSSSSASEEEHPSKKPRWMDSSDGPKTVKSPAVTDQQLLMLAKCMGKEWKQLGILYLNLSKKDIDQSQAKDEDLTIQKFIMLDEWRKRAKNNATLELLHQILNGEDVPHEVRDVLENMLNSQNQTTS